MFSITNSYFNVWSYESYNTCCFPNVDIPDSLHTSDTYFGFIPHIVSVAQDVFDGVVAYGVLVLNQLL